MLPTEEGVEGEGQAASVPLGLRASMNRWRGSVREER
jgi:hypothetical protein